MVIFDSTNNYDNQIKGMLYLNMMDVDYLMSKYSSETLKAMIPLDYVETFESELKQRLKEDKLSIQYYSILTLGIETEEDEELLRIIKNEVAEGNLFTKKALQSIKREELSDLVSPLEDGVDLLTFVELYKLRSYHMVEFILDSIDKSDRALERLYNHSNMPGLLDFYRSINVNLEAIGLSSKIVESDYFEKGKKLN